jgi:adenylate kinase
MAKSKKLVLIIMGPPGSGKGTQAELLAEKLSLYYLETSKILEEKFKELKEKFVEIEGQRYFFQKEKNLWLAGKLCSPPFVTYLVIEKIKDLAKQGKNLILSGSPRTVYEGERLVPVLKKLYGKGNIKVILLEQSEKVTIWRNSRRRICQLMRHPILSTKKEFLNLKYCPLDGSKLLKRKGLDDPETIKVRLKEYKERTLPLLTLFKKEKIKINKIDATPPPAIVFENILKVLGSFK